MTWIYPTLRNVGLAPAAAPLEMLEAGTMAARRSVAPAEALTMEPAASAPELVVRESDGYAQCPCCSRWVPSDMLVQIEAVPAEKRCRRTQGEGWACDACLATLDREEICTKPELFEYLGAPAALIAKQLERQARRLAARGIREAGAE